ncbi:MAG: type II toxin-antitoxin system ParD family antitoxin [Burkholderiales bacterium]|nr:type II toxin-antitoxin system ParD family antitoxin [Burkholderiales bacterium]
MGNNVSLTPQPDAYVRAKVESGLYASASEVVREALRLLQEQDRLQAIKLEELRQEVRRGLSSGPTVPHDGAALKNDLRARRAKRAA